jgi:hypothetical protein
MDVIFVFRPPIHLALNGLVNGLLLGCSRIRTRRGVPTRSTDRRRSQGTRFDPFCAHSSPNRSLNFQASSSYCLASSPTQRSTCALYRSTCHRRKWVGCEIRKHGGGFADLDQGLGDGVGGRGGVLPCVGADDAAQYARHAQSVRNSLGPGGHFLFNAGTPLFSRRFA